MTIRLLPIPRRAWLKSFGLIMSLLSLLGFSVAASRFQSTPVMACGVCIAVGLAVVASLWPRFWMVPYRVWNKLARLYGQFARVYLLRLCYLVVSAAGLGGQSRDFARDGRAGSGWIPRSSATGSSNRNQSHDNTQASLNRGWIRVYASWAIEAGQYWSLALLPFLMVLSAMDIEEGSQPLTKTYTLF